MKCSVRAINDSSHKNSLILNDINVIFFAYMADVNSGLAQSRVGIAVPSPRSWCTQVFVRLPWVSLTALKFDFKHDCAPPTILLGPLLCP